MPDKRSKFVPVLSVSVAVVGVVWLVLLLRYQRGEPTPDPSSSAPATSLLAMVPENAQAVLYAAPSLVKPRLQSAAFYKYIIDTYGGDPFHRLDSNIRFLGLDVDSIAEAVVFITEGGAQQFLPTTVIFRYTNISSDPSSLFPEGPRHSTRMSGRRIAYLRDQNGYELMHDPPYVAVGNAPGALQWIDEALSTGRSILTNPNLRRFLNQHRSHAMYGIVTQPGKLLSSLGEPFASATSVTTDLDIRRGVQFTLSVDTPNVVTTLKTAAAVAKAWPAPPPGYDAPTIIAYELAKGLAMIFAESSSIAQIRTWGRLHFELKPKRLSLRFSAPES